MDLDRNTRFAANEAFDLSLIYIFSAFCKNIALSEHFDVYLVDSEVEFTFCPSVTTTVNHNISAVLDDRGVGFVAKKSDICPTRPPIF